ncbi:MULTISPECIES: serine protease [unclassified Sphingobacterium]|uniref:S1 family peptidase n=1 Tax=unclassified Sphingobacterium TaxID=2609468 RepID=UPI00140491BE|nr:MULTISPECIES: serine protease [unclassified Sphingobacterium]MCS3556554.1 S1-C subfamily serine protease [Sphingobacterium sp. JUb21]
MSVIIGILIAPFAHCSTQDSVSYIDKVKMTSVLEAALGKMVNGHPEWGAKAMRSRLNAAEGNKKVAVDIKLPKPHKKFMKPVDMYNQRGQGVLMVGKYFDCGKCDKLHAMVIATAVVLTEDGVCLTNRHVMESMMAKTASAEADSAYFLAGLNGQVYPILDVLSYAQDADLAVIKIDPRGKKLSPVQLGESLHAGEDVRTLTHPMANFYYYSEGVVARNTQDESKGWESRRMDITADYAVGSSGGPIFDEKGNLAALVSTTQSLGTPSNRGIPGSHQMTIHSTIPVSSIRRLFK